MGKKKPNPKAEAYPLSKEILVGDRIRLKPNKGIAYRAAYDFDESAIRTVTRADTVSHGDRLWVDGPPFMFWPSDVELAWNSDDARRAGLREKGWRV